MEIAWMPNKRSCSFLWALSAKKADMVPAELLLIFKRARVDTMDTIILKKPKNKKRLTQATILTVGDDFVFTEVAGQFR